MMAFDIEHDEREESGAPVPMPFPAPTGRPGYPTLGRTLPHSLEAEEFLLSSCLLDGTEMVERCLEAKVTVDSFYDSKHGVVFAQLVDLYERRVPIDVAVVAEELKTARKLDQIGGYAFLAQVSSRVPTTVQAGYFIEKVREQALLRAFIRAGTGMVEDCYGFSGDLEQFVVERRGQLDAAFDGVAGGAALAEACRFDPAAPIVDSKVAYRLGEVIVSTAGNLTNIVSKAGAGKSGTLDAMLAAAMKDRDAEADCLGFTADNMEGLPLLHFDTEQSAADYQRLLHRSLRRSLQKEFPPWFASYHLTGKTPMEGREIVRGVIKRAARKWGGIFAILIDGWGDLVVDPNDTEECFPFVAEMHALAIRHNCSIIGVLHLNPGTEKSRGHLGSQLERKAESVLQLEKDDDTEVTAIFSTKKRGAPISRASGPRFAWDQGKAMHCTVGDWQARAAMAREEKKAAKAAANPGGFQARYSREEQVSFYPASTAKEEARGVVFRRAQELSHVSPATLDRLRREFLTEGWIAQTPGGNYRRTAEGDMWAARRPAPTPKAELPGMAEEEVDF